jgi:hypothetical protein
MNGYQVETQSVRRYGDTVGISAVQTTNTDRRQLSGLRQIPRKTKQVWSRLRSRSSCVERLPDHFHGNRARGLTTSKEAGAVTALSGHA